MGAAALVLSAALFPARYTLAVDALDSQELTESVDSSGDASDEVADPEGGGGSADVGSKQGSGEAGDAMDESSGTNAGAPSESTDSGEPAAEAPEIDSSEAGESDSASFEAEGSESDESVFDESTTEDESEAAEPSVASLQSCATSYSVITLGGSDRYETSAKQALYAFPRTEWAIVASGAGYADAIGVACLVGALQCPIILAEPQSLSSTTSSALRQTGVKHVILLGGTTVSSNGVEQQLRSLVGSGGTVGRVWGTDRYATQMAVCQYGRPHGLWTGSAAIVAPTRPGLPAPCPSLRRATSLRYRCSSLTARTTFSPRREAPFSPVG